MQIFTSLPGRSGGHSAGPNRGRRTPLFLAAAGLLSAGLSGVAAPAPSANQRRIDPEEHKLIVSDRPDGRFVSTRGFVQSLLREARPQLAFRPEFTPAEFGGWQKDVRTKLRELMRFPPTAASAPPKLVVAQRRDGYVVQRWEAYPQPGSAVPFLVLVPETASAEKPAPAVLCFPGSDWTKENLAGEPELSPARPRPHTDRNSMALYYVRQGFVAVALDNPGIGETADIRAADFPPHDERSTLSRYLLDLGWHYLGLSAFQGELILNWMKTRKEIDRGRIALSGHSLGTEPVLVLGVLDPDVRAVVFNDYLCRLIVRAKAVTKPGPDGRRPAPNWLGHCVPDLWRWFDYPDLLASLAPRPLLVTEGGATADLQLVRRAYEITSQTQNVGIHYYPKYADPGARRDGVEMPDGLSQPEWFEYVNVDAANHYFKADIAVPWLTAQLAPRRGSGGD